MLNKHTPWVANEDEIHNGEGHLVTVVSGDHQSFDQDKRYAAQIVACVNACLGLLRAAKVALQGMEGGADDAPCHKGICSREECGQCRRVDGLRVAIAEAEEEQCHSTSADR